MDFPQFFGVEPKPQNALDLFKGEWSTRLPDATGLVASTGPMRGCEDYRLDWFEPLVGGFANKRALELGPLEGGHSYMLDQRGAKEVLSIEANPRAFLKCLILKEIFRLTRVHFELGDFMKYLETTREHFDIGLASGVLYHLLEPMDLIRGLARACDAVLVWTHFYDAEYMAAHHELGRRFHLEPEIRETDGYKYRAFRKRYDEAKEWKGFCGGGGVEAVWLLKDDILGAFRHFGFETTGCVVEKNANGPALLLAVKRVKSTTGALA